MGVVILRDDALKKKTMKLLFIMALLALGILFGYAIGANLYYPFHGNILRPVAFIQGLTLFPEESGVTRVEIPSMPGCRGAVLDRKSGSAMHRRGMVVSEIAFLILSNS